MEIFTLFFLLFLCEIYNNKSHSKRRGLDMSFKNFSDGQKNEKSTKAKEAARSAYASDKTPPESKKSEPPKAK